MYKKAEKKYVKLSLFDSQHIKISIFDLKNTTEQIVKTMKDIIIIIKLNITFFNGIPLNVYFSNLKTICIANKQL